MGTGEPTGDTQSPRGIRATLTADISTRQRPAFRPLPDRYTPHATPPRTRHQYVTLDGLRGVAALCVVLLHSGGVFAGNTPFPHAFLAVDFFLQLSGFIVAHAYGRKVSAGMPLSTFTRRRIGRLYPAYLLGAVLGIAAALVAGWDTPTLLCSIGPHMLMMPVTCGVHLYLFPLNPPMWSIVYEVVFSFAFFAAAAHLMVKRIAVTVALVALMLVVMLLGGSFDVGNRVFYGDAQSGFIRLGFSFLVGVAVYTLGITARRMSRYVPVIIAFTLAAVLLLPFASAEYDLAMVVIVFPAVLIAGSIYNPTGHHLTWLLVQLGILSYMLYAIHYPILEMFSLWIPDADGWATAGIIVLATVLAWALARTYEPHARRLFDRLTTSPGEMTKAPLEAHPKMSPEGRMR